MAWLSNVLNRAAAGLMSESSRALYNSADTCKLLQLHFKDLLDSLEVQDDEEDAAAADEAEDGAAK